MSERNSPVVSIGMGLAVGALVGMVFQHAMPTLVDHRVGDQDDAHASSALRTATWTSIAVVTGTALIAKDPTVFVLGGAITVGLNLWHRHANMVNPLTGKAVASGMPVPDTGATPDMAYEADEA